MSSAMPIPNEGYEVRESGRWCEIVEREPLRGDALRSQLGAPGLWRSQRRNGSFHRAFDLLPATTAHTMFGGDLSPEDARDAWVEWAERTAGGTPGETWTPPGSVEAAGWIDEARLIVRAGRHIAQGELVCADERLAIEFPIARIEPEITPARAAWIAEICIDAQARTRLVRFGIDESAAFVRAEVDLSGLPSTCARPALRLALEALRRAVRGALPAFALLNDPGVRSRALDRGPWWRRRDPGGHVGSNDNTNQNENGKRKE